MSTNNVAPVVHDPPPSTKHVACKKELAIDCVAAHQERRTGSDGQWRKPSAVVLKVAEAAKSKRERACMAASIKNGLNKVETRAINEALSPQLKTKLELEKRDATMANNNL